MRGRLGALEERPFRLLWIGQSTSAIGDAISGIALAWAVFEIGESASALGLVLAAFTAGRVVFILAGGVWSDRLSRQHVMVACDLVRFGTQAAVAAALIMGVAELWHLVVAGLLVGGASAFFGPASTGLIPETVSPARLQQANALMSTSGSAAWLAGPVIANEELGGATDWGLAMTISAAGGLAGSLLALRYRPARPLIPSFLAMIFASVALLSLVPPVPAVGIGIAAGLMFLGIQLGNALWHTMMQQHVPANVLSRVSSYDWLVSLVFMPLGFTLAGPLADAIGLDTTLIAAAILSAAANLGVLLVPSIRNLRRLDEPAPAAA